MRRILFFAALLMSLLSPYSASADGQLAPTQPSWWTNREFKDIRYGIWLPCNESQDIKDDCIMGVNLYSPDGNFAGKLTYTPPKDFDPKTFRQLWVMYPDGKGGSYEGVTYSPQYDGAEGEWLLPNDLKNSDGTNIVRVSVNMFGQWVHINMRPKDYRISSVPSGYYFEYILQSKVLSRDLRWTHANFHDPQVKINGSLIYVRGLPDRSPAPPGGATVNVCESNEVKAISSELNMVTNLMMTEPGKSNMTDPDDVVVATNGWYCLGNLRFDRETQQIKVEVGNAHYDENGNVVEGWLEVKIRGERARAWWNIAPEIAAGYAKVDVSYPNGISKVATVTARYDKINDWISLKAYGFTYSKPTISISFKNPVKSSAPKQSTKSILCIKNKLVKKVVGTNPKCPTGYTIK